MLTYNADFMDFSVTSPSDQPIKIVITKYVYILLAILVTTYFPLCSVVDI